MCMSTGLPNPVIECGNPAGQCVCYFFMDSWKITDDDLSLI
jgi:hypothetical protein